MLHYCMRDACGAGSTMCAGRICEIAFAFKWPVAVRACAGTVDAVFFNGIVSDE